MNYRPAIRKTGYVSGVLLIATIVLAPYVSPLSPTDVAPSHQFLPPSIAHWLGTDQFGRDVFSRLLWGGRMSLLGASIATMIAVVAGSLIGAGAAGFGGRVDRILMRGVDVSMAFPAVLVAMLFVASAGPGLWPAALGTGIALAPGFSRLVRASLLAVRKEPFVEAARVLGGTSLYITLRHLIPNIKFEIISYCVVIFAWSILNIAGLEYLGLAGPPDSLSWGRMLYDGRSYLSIAPWIAWSAGSAIVLTTIFIIQISEAFISSGRKHRDSR
jgi:peptide/nickel transport system permease protein